MALPKKKSKSIAIGGRRYLYIVSQGQYLGDGTFSLNVTAQREEGSGAKLAVHGIATRDFWLDISEGAHDLEEYVSLTPKHVECMILLALDRGWEPDVDGPPFALTVTKDTIQTRTA